MASHLKRWKKRATESDKSSSASDLSRRSECGICLNDIVDQSEKSEGEDSVFCEGACQKWLHHTCAGLSDAAFEVILKSNDKFYCYQCFVTSHGKQMKELQESQSMLNFLVPRQLFPQDSFEGTSILISSSLDISCVYVLPASDFSYILALLDFINNLKIEHCHLVLGEFNMPDICWDSMTAKSVGSDLFCEAILNKNLCQLVREPTRIKGNILDLVLSDVLECVYDVKVINETYSSDHYLISLTYSMHLRANSFKSGTSYRLSFNWSQADWKGLTDYLFDTDFSRCFVLDDVNKSWELIRDEILTACRHFIPTSRSRNKNSLPWFTPHIVHTMNKIRTLRRSLKSKQSPSILSKIET